MLAKLDIAPETEETTAFEGAEEVLASPPPPVERDQPAAGVHGILEAKPTLATPPSNGRLPLQPPPAVGSDTADWDTTVPAALQQLSEELAGNFKEVLAKTVSNLQAPAAEERRMLDVTFDSVRRVARDLEALSARLELAYQKIDSQDTALHELAGQFRELEDSVNVLATAVHSVQNDQKGLEKRTELQAGLLREVDDAVQCRGDQLDRFFQALRNLQKAGIDQGPSPPPQRLPEVEKAASVLEPEAVGQPTHLPSVRTRLPRPVLRQHGWLIALVLTGCVGLSCGLIFAQLERMRQKPSPSTEGSIATSAVKTEATALKHMKAQGEVDTSPSVGDQRVAPEQPATLQLAGKLLLDLAATEATWVSLTVDGQAVLAGLLSPGDTKSFQGTERMSLRIGNAGGLQVQWNGQPIGPIGRRGEVCLVAFTREGFRIQHEGM